MTDEQDNNAYLWDKSGPADEFVRDLEQKLAPLSSSANTAQEAPAIVKPRRKWRARALGVVVTVGALGLAGAAVLALVVALTPPPPIVASGDALLDGKPLGPSTSSASAVLPAGKVLVARGDVDVDLGPHGQVTVAAGSRLRVVKNDKDAQSLALDLGHLSAIVDAPPEFFSVETPSVKAVDRGCAYTVDVDAAGNTRVRVTSGAVVLKGAHDVVTFVPAGAVALTLAHAQPGLPYASGADSAFVDAVEREDVARVVELAGARDAITLWNILARDPDQAAAFQKLKAVAPSAAKVSDARDVVAMYAALDDIEDRLAALAPSPAQHRPHTTSVPASH